MNPANATSGSGTATTSANARAADDVDALRDKFNMPEPGVSESDYLERQAEAAKKAIADALSDLKSDLAKGVDPRKWMKNHPWIALGSAAVAGFAAAATAVPSREQQALRKLEAIERAIHARDAKPPVNGDGADAPPKAAGGGILTTLLHELITALKPVILGLISARFSPPPREEEPEPAMDERHG